MAVLPLDARIKAMVFISPEFHAEGKYDKGYDSTNWEADPKDNFYDWLAGNTFSAGYHSGRGGAYLYFDGGLLCEIVHHMPDDFPHPRLHPGDEGPYTRKVVIRTMPVNSIPPSLVSALESRGYKELKEEPPRNP